jgi:7-cyano-7-deazaguanine tRNA-ribosyltransferase
MMSFEIREKDLLARIGKLETKSGILETPLLFPVVNPLVQPISPKQIRAKFGFEALITNAYIMKKRFKEQLSDKGVHRFLDFDGVVMTDSGAYQILVYGDVDVTPAEIVEYQEKIKTDIATILDVPTSWKVSEQHAEQTVDETLKRAKELFNLKTRDDILWVGPVQGGKNLNLVARSAKEMAKLPFAIYALGSPTEIMENYRFDVLVDMIMVAKLGLPIERPFHLFGAGHPFMFSLAVALGCDLFDSAAYALYARDDRYMTETGTCKLMELEHFPCSCPVCTGTTPKQVSDMTEEQKQVFLAEHNLYTCAAELKRIKQAINDGRLWEHLEIRAHGHPSLLQALKRLKKYEALIEKHAPAAKDRGLFFFNSVGLVRPEVVRYRNRLRERYVSPTREKSALLLVPQTRTKPFHKSKKFRDMQDTLRKVLTGSSDRLHACFYVAPFGAVPCELDEVYPLSQHETALPYDRETIEYVADQVASYIIRANYETVILLDDPENWKSSIFNACKKSCLKKKIRFKRIKTTEMHKRSVLEDLRRFIEES